MTPETVSWTVAGVCAAAILVVLIGRRPVPDALFVCMGGLVWLAIARWAGPHRIPALLYHHMGDYLQGVTFSIAIYVAIARRSGLPLVLGLCWATDSIMFYSATLAYVKGWIKGGGGQLEPELAASRAGQIVADQWHSLAAVMFYSPWLLILWIVYLLAFKGLRGFRHAAPEIALVGSVVLVICQETVKGFVPNTLDLWDIPAGVIGAALFYEYSRRDRLQMWQPEELSQVQEAPSLKSSMPSMVRLGAAILFTVVAPGTGSLFIRRWKGIWPRCLLLFFGFVVALIVFGPLWSEVIYRSAPDVRGMGLWPFLLCYFVILICSVQFVREDLATRRLVGDVDRISGEDKAIPSAFQRSL